jgi:hypothetical protein
MYASGKERRPITAAAADSRADCSSDACAAAAAAARDVAAAAAAAAAVAVAAPLLLRWSWDAAAAATAAVVAAAAAAGLTRVREGKVQQLRRASRVRRSMRAAMQTRMSGSVSEDWQRAGCVACKGCRFPCFYAQLTRAVFASS